MRVVEIIGKVTLSKAHPTLRGASWKLGVSLSHAEIKGRKNGRGEPFVIFDELGASQGCKIAVAEGPEASAPFHPNQKPIDAYNAAILDTIDVE